MSDDAPAAEDREVRHSPVRRLIAARLTQSKQTVPHFYVTVRALADPLLALRRALNDAAPEAKLSLNDLVVRAVALALREVPAANVSFEEKVMRHHGRIDVAVAVSTPRGLVTPIVRDADHRTPREIAEVMRDLAARARTGRLAPEEYMGGTASVSNLGMFGVEEFSAIINPPHACIFAVGAVMPQAVVIDGEVQAANVLTTTISFDHRAIDGDVGATLAAAYKRLLETPRVLDDLKH